ncbi:hypothetical protein [Clostridium sporogenes]|uniref:defense against restriction DarA-related protein n=1 Tax=Clostridium sporogenes TaxID=1509 RepID=UPI00311AB744
MFLLPVRSIAPKPAAGKENAKQTAAATRDYENRVAEYQHNYGVSAKSAYRYYSTQRPVDIGTFPKTENGPLYLVNFDKRESVEHYRFLAWGYLVYDAPLTEKQMADYELRAAPGNPDREPEKSKSIAARLAEGAKQVARDNAALTAPAKGTEKDR